MSKQEGSSDSGRLTGFKYFRQISDLLDRLRAHATERDKAGNRNLFYDQYACLLLLYFFNPTVTTLRGIQRFSNLKKVQNVLGVSRTSLGSLSEAANVFDPSLLESIIAELAERTLKSPQSKPPASKAALEGLAAVDGSVLKAVPRMAWALWQDEQHRAVKIHTAVNVWSQLPTNITVTAANGSERDELRNIVEPGGFYVADRGYADYSLFQELDEKGCYFVIRVQENAAYEIETENNLNEEAREVGVVGDYTLRRLGTEKHNALLKKPFRLLEVKEKESGQRWVLVTNRQDLSADIIAAAYKHRWQVELFFRWLKCVLGCRRLISESQQGVTIQIYLAIIASLLIGLWLGIKPNKPAFEMICHYLNGWASLDELESFLLKQYEKAMPP